MPLRGRSISKLGVDVVNVTRFLKYTSADCPQDQAYHFLDKYLSPREAIVYLRRKSDERVAAQFLAGRWAIKEAIIKCLSPNKPFARDIEVYQQDWGQIYALVYPQPAWHDFRWSSCIAPVQGLDRWLHRHASTSQLFRAVHIRAGRPVGTRALNVNLLALTVALDMAQDEDAFYIDVSLSHDGDVAVAIASAAAEDVANWRGIEETSADESTQANKEASPGGSVPEMVNPEHQNGSHHPAGHKELQEKPSMYDTLRKYLRRGK